MVPDDTPLTWLLFRMWDIAGRQSAFIHWMVVHLDLCIYAWMFAYTFQQQES